ncbi:DUF2848 domain-containing protein [Amorphus orientalis]|uniref:DUF2848 domain-containing protein n=1 Tax=Amorphus orientalis TaxID=649198 RepID=A0AAE3VLI9_9HYPH|nr:DUF2848 domain-containing protein [Amorphus orientalis]MDQ0314374.1 hypothetical protein [Amorphus orientalis]
MTELSLRIDSLSGSREETVAISDLVIAGWTGRNKEAMEHHIAELEALGVKRPPQTPMFYRVSTSRLTTDGAIEVLGGDSSGEAEFVLIAAGDALYVGVGSDHTDRKAEAVGVSLSKQMCDKPVGVSVWPYTEVKDHWDELMVRSHAVIDGARVLYQEGPIAGMLSPDALLERYDGGRLAPGTAMFGGTLPAIGGVRPAERFECEIWDPVLNRGISCAYDIKALPDLG